MPEVDAKEILDMSEEERLAELETEGFELFRQLMDPYISLEANQVACDLFAVQLQKVLKDPDTAAKLTPSGQPFGCKRQVMDTGYYETFNRPNVDLVDLRRGGITAITPMGVSTEQGDVELDALVMATGFDAVRSLPSRPDVRALLIRIACRPRR